MSSKGVALYPDNRDLVIGMDQPAPAGARMLSASDTFSRKIEAMTNSTDQTEAVSGTVTGHDQQVGFRAMIMKQAIALNLAGFARNLPDDVVSFHLQGPPGRLADAVAAIEQGTKKSADIKVATAPAAVDPGLTAFTVAGWTSTSRNITTPYDLAFALRPEDTELSDADTQIVWQSILKSTLKGDDLAKLKG